MQAVEVTVPAQQQPEYSQSLSANSDDRDIGDGEGNGHSSSHMDTRDSKDLSEQNSLSTGSLDGMECGSTSPVPFKHPALEPQAPVLSPMVRTSLLRESLAPGDPSSQHPALSRSRMSQIPGYSQPQFTPTNMPNWEPSPSGACPVQDTDQLLEDGVPTALLPQMCTSSEALIPIPHAICCLAFILTMLQQALPLPCFLARR
jgi:hypothetical protein